MFYHISSAAGSFPLFGLQQFVVDQPPIAPLISFHHPSRHLSYPYPRHLDVWHVDPPSCHPLLWRSVRRLGLFGVEVCPAWRSIRQGVRGLLLVRCCCAASWLWGKPFWTFILLLLSDCLNCYVLVSYHVSKDIITMIVRTELNSSTHLDRVEQLFPFGQSGIALPIWAEFNSSANLDSFTYFKWF